MPTGGSACRAGPKLGLMAWPIHKWARAGPGSARGLFGDPCGILIKYLEIAVDNLIWDAIGYIEDIWAGYFKPYFQVPSTK